jgi:hypothetical protein
VNAAGLTVFVQSQFSYLLSHLNQSLVLGIGIRIGFTSSLFLLIKMRSEFKFEAQ